MGHLQSEIITEKSLHVWEIIVRLFKSRKYKPCLGTDTRM